MNQEIDQTKGYVTLADGTVWQVLAAGGDFDDAATAAAIAAYLESLHAA